MFAGLSGLIVDDSGTEITGISSREGEVIMFKRIVSLKDHPKIYEWLTKVEEEMKFTLASLLQDYLSEMEATETMESLDIPAYLSWIERCPAQLVVLATQVLWTQRVEQVLNNTAGSASLETILSGLETKLNTLADNVLLDLPPIKRAKFEYLITECVHQRDVTRKLVQNKVTTVNDFDWLYQMRFYWDNNADTLLKKLVIRMANASFFYGFEYLGVAERLVQTPLTDRCYLALTQV